MTIVRNEDLPEGMKKRQNLAHVIAKRIFIEAWNFSIDECEKMGCQITGNEALSYLTTIIAHIGGKWIVEMNKIAQIDDAGVEREELIKGVLNGILAFINCKAEWDNEKPELPNGIKRINK